MTHLINRAAMTALGLLCAFQASAQSAYPPTLADPYYAAALPSSGAYFDPTRPGSGMFVDMRPDGAVFIHIATYDAQGEPTWFAIQDRFDPAYAFDIFEGNPSIFGWVYSDSIGSVTAPVYRTHAGACLGCTYVPPVIEEATDLGGADLTWTNTGDAIVTIAGNSTHWTLLPLDGRDADKLAGTWRMQAASGLDLGGEARCNTEDCDAWFDAVVQIKPIEMLQLQIDDFVLQGFGPTAPEHVTHWFEIECIERCEIIAGNPMVSGTLWSSQPEYDYVDGQIRVVVWLDERSGKAGIEQLINNEHVTNYLAGRRHSFSLHRTGEHWMARRQYMPGNIYPVVGFHNARPLDGSLIRLDRIDD